MKFEFNSMLVGTASCIICIPKDKIGDSSMEVRQSNNFYKLFVIPDPVPCGSRPYVGCCFCCRRYTGGASGDHVMCPREKQEVTENER